jgi:hypothetical protein
MNIVEILILIVGTVVIVEILYKNQMKHRLDDIDGFYGVHKEDPKEPHEKVIGSFGDVKDTK